MDDMLTYIEQIVEPTISDFEANPTSVRHAFLACVATFHAIDYLAWPFKSRSYRDKFKLQSQEFARIDKIAHAFKHVEIHYSKDQRLNVREVVSRPPGVWSDAIWDLSRWDDPAGGVTIEGNPKVDVLQDLHASVRFLKSLAQE